MMQAAQLAVRPEVSRAVARIMSGAHFTCLLLDDKAQRATALESVLDKVADLNTRVVWVGNPLRSPLTIERFLIQIVGPEVDLRIERSAAELAQLISQPIGDESRLLVVVQQPETMGAEARDRLALLPAHLAGNVLQVQFLFVSSSNFTLMTFTEPNTPLAPPPPVAAPRSSRTLYILLPITFLLGIALGIAIALAPAGKLNHILSRFLPAIASAPAAAPPTAASASAPVVAPPTAAIASVPAVAPPTVQPPQTPAPPASPDLGALRREFDDFLAKRAPTTPPLTTSQKDSLFQEFLTRHRRD